MGGAPLIQMMLHRCVSVVTLMSRLQAHLPNMERARVCRDEARVYALDHDLAVGRLHQPQPQLVSLRRLVQPDRKESIRLLPGDEPISDKTWKYIAPGTLRASPAQPGEMVSSGATRSGTWLSARSSGRRASDWGV